MCVCCVCAFICFYIKGTRAHTIEHTHTHKGIGNSVQRDRSRAWALHAEGGRGRVVYGREGGRVLPNLGECGSSLASAVRSRVCASSSSLDTPAPRNRFNSTCVFFLSFQLSSSSLAILSQPLFSWLVRTSDNIHPRAQYIPIYFSLLISISFSFASRVRATREQPFCVFRLIRGRE